MGCKRRLTTTCWRWLKQRNGLSLGEEGKEVAGSCARGLSAQSFSWESPTAHSKMLVMVQGDLFPVMVAL